LNEKIEVYHKFENKLIGVIEVVGTSLQHQLVIVFEKGGGVMTEIDFGTVFFGQIKEISGFLVNNGPYSINYKFFFHPDKTPEEINPKEVDYSCTPYEAAIEMTRRVLSAAPDEGKINPYEQVRVLYK